MLYFKPLILPHRPPRSSNDNNDIDELLTKVKYIIVHIIWVIDVKLKI